MTWLNHISQRIDVRALTIVAAICASCLMAFSLMPQVVNADENEAVVKDNALRTPRNWSPIVMVETVEEPVSQEKSEYEETSYESSWEDTSSYYESTTYYEPTYQETTYEETTYTEPEPTPTSTPTEETAWADPVETAWADPVETAWADPS